jgi:transposase
MVQAIVNQLRPLMVSIKELDKQIAELFAKHEDHELFSSFPGTGEVLAPRLLSVLGADRDRFESAEEIQQLSGIATVTERSGKTCWVHHRFACPKLSAITPQGTILAGGL